MYGRGTCIYIIAAKIGHNIAVCDIDKRSIFSRVHRRSTEFPMDMLTWTCVRSFDVPPGQDYLAEVVTT